MNWCSLITWRPETGACPGGVACAEPCDAGCRADQVRQGRVEWLIRLGVRIG